MNYEEDYLKLVELLLADNWHRNCEIIVDWMPRYPDAKTRPMTVVKCGTSYLRCSGGISSTPFWDMYPEDMLHTSGAIFCLSKAPVPPCEQKKWYKKDEHTTDIKKFNKDMYLKEE